MDELYGYRLRAHQAQVLRYVGGRMAISAVPGSGKTLTLALLAAQLILEGRLQGESEVLVVTVQNSAVDNIAARIRRILAEQKLPPIGYRVCTLHKLASDILRQRLDLAGASEELAIVDESESRRFMRQAVETWIAGHADWWASFLPSDAQGDPKRISDDWRKQTESLGLEAAKLCKHLRLTPEAAQALVEPAGPEADFARMGVALYALYERYLRARGGLDFDDLIWRAIEALDQDVTFAANLGRRWAYVLEDEAQDSSPLQEAILRRLCGPQGNWVRVGDPNQAINATFTAADPQYFRRFLEGEGVVARTLPESGRSARPIMAMANALVDWTCAEHPEPDVRASAFQPQHIVPTEPLDPQQNPSDAECTVHIHQQPFESVDAEARWLADYAARYLRANPDHSVAVLAPAGWLGNKVLEELGRIGNVPFQDLLRTTPEARDVARLLAAACRYLGDPGDARALARLLTEMAPTGLLGEVNADLARDGAALVRSVAVPDLLFPRMTRPLRDILPPKVEGGEPLLAVLERLAALAGRWVRASALPIDQLLLTIGQDLLPEDDQQGGLAPLAICHSLAGAMRSTAMMHPEMRLAGFALELADVAHNRRGIRELALPDENYLTKSGVIVVTTMHKAKGLEWDAVLGMCADSVEFPSALEDPFRSEPYYLPGRAPALEARRCLERLAEGEPAPEVADSIREGRLENIAERLRLLYVTVTRAKRVLFLSHSRANGRFRVSPARALEVLRAAHSAYRAGEVT